MSESISIRGLSKSYGSTRAVDQLNLTVEKGEFFGFLGPNGAGKTTTIRILTGMLPPDKGDVRIDGLAISEREQIAGRIGVVPESRGLYGWMTALQYLDFFASLYGVKDKKTTIDTLLRKVDLLSSRDTAIGTFSRGMKQRLSLAKALINSPSILFLDEPTLGLDPQGQEDIQALLRSLHQQGVTIFLSSHLLYEVAHLCTKLAIINKGKLIASGTLAELRKKANLREVYRVRVEGNVSALESSKFRSHIKDIRSEDNAVQCSFEGSSSEINALLDDLRSCGIPLLELTPQSGDLTDIFLTMTSPS